MRLGRWGWGHGCEGNKSPHFSQYEIATSHIPYRLPLRTQMEGHRNSNCAIVIIRDHPVIVFLQRLKFSAIETIAIERIQEATTRYEFRR